MKINRCIECGNSDIEIFECGYSSSYSSNPGGGRCNKCGNKVTKYVDMNTPKEKLIEIWNEGQKPKDKHKLKEERKKTRKLRSQLRRNNIKPEL